MSKPMLVLLMFSSDVHVYSPDRPTARHKKNPAGVFLQRLLKQFE